MRAALFLALACALFALAACATVEKAERNSEVEAEVKAQVASEEKVEDRAEKKVEENSEVKLAVTCEENAEEQTAEKAEEKPKEGEGRAERQEPEHVSVDHILIGVKHERLKNVTRSNTEAEALADQIMSELKAGGDWNTLKDKYSDDRSDGKPGGPYRMANNGFKPDASLPEYKRNQMVPSFGNVGFALDVGEIGVAAHDPKASPFGYHIIKRIK